MKQCIKYCLIIIFAALLHDSATGAADILCVPATRQAECCTLSQAPTTQQAVQKFYDLFTKLPLHRTCGPYASTNQQKRTPAHVHLQDAAACLCTGMRPFVESVSSSRTRRELLRVRAKKDYHLEGLQAQTLAPDLAGQQIRGFVLRCDVSIIIYLKSYQVYELYFVSGRLIDGNRFRGYRHRALQCDSTPFVQCTEDGAVRVWYPYPR